MNEGYFSDWNPERIIKVVDRDGTVSVVVKGREYMSWSSGDEESKRIAIVQLYKSGLGSQEQLAEAFEVHVKSVKKYIKRFSLYGSRGLVSQRRGPRGSWKLTPRVRSKILTVVMREGISGLEAVQERLRDGWHEEVSLPSIRQVLVEDGLIDEARVGCDSGVVQGELFDVADREQSDLNFDCAENGAEKISDSRPKDVQEDEEEQESDSILTGPNPRSMRHYSSAQRIYLDRIERGDYNAYAGGFLFAPLLKQYGFISTLKRVVEIPTHEGYTFDDLCLTLFYFDVFGFQSMEDFKRAYPEEFGVLIGRSQSPSVYTLRRFLHKVRNLSKGEELIDEFALSYLKHGLAHWGVMYIDGHFLPYHGIYPITKGWHGVRKIPMKGSYNFLVVDEGFRPWLFLVRASSEDLLQKIPELIEKAKKIGCAAGLSREVVDELIVVFDREGYSAALYRQLEGKDQGDEGRRAVFISWAKYADKWVYDIAEEEFDKTVNVVYEIRKPEAVRYFETERMMNKYGKIRAIVIQSRRENKRMAIYTNGTQQQISAKRVVQLMCCRWGEENRIKDLLTKHMINYMPGYVMEGMEEQPLVENPKVKQLKKKRSSLLSELHKFKLQLADEVLKQRQNNEIKIRLKGMPPLENIVRIDNEILLLNHQLDELPEKVQYDEAHFGRKLLALNYEKKRFLDCIKLFTCNIKAEMCRMLLKHYDYPKEIQPALSMIVSRAGHVEHEGGELLVKLRRFTNPEVDYAARHLCEDLNEMHPVTTDRFGFPIRYLVM
jgi:transposase